MGERNTRTNERHAQIPHSILESDAWHWLPDFARIVVVAFAAQFNGINNGGLELTESDAERYGITRGALWAGIGLALHVKLIKRTLKARRRAGRGKPAKYALTWRELAEFPAYNIVGTDAPTNTWENFKPSSPKLTSIIATERFLGYRKSKKPSGGPFRLAQADRSDCSPHIQADRSDSKTPTSGGPLRLPSKNLGRGTQLRDPAGRFTAGSTPEMDIPK